MNVLASNIVMPYFFGRCSAYASVMSSHIVSVSTYTDELFSDRTEMQCLRRFFNTELIKGPWTQEEVDKIIDLVNKYGLTNWSRCKVSYQKFLLLIL